MTADWPVSRAPLSKSETGKLWLAQFSSADDVTAASQLLDVLLLLNDSEVADAVRSGIDRLAEEWSNRRRFLGLYAEREFDESTVFTSDDVPDPTGLLRRRAVRYSGPVKPTRGKARVGSEGSIAHLISQQVEKWPRILKNHPGPINIRAKSSPVGGIVIVTDLIGTGTRVERMLDKFWSVPSVKSWVSLKLLRFFVVAAAGTLEGIAAVKSHRVKPTVFAERVVPTIGTWKSEAVADEWRRLIANYGPSTGRDGVPRGGFRDIAALVALSSGIPNNTPAIIHRSEGKKWRALYEGPAPAELKPYFRSPYDAETVNMAASTIGVELAKDLSVDNAKLVVVLSAPRALLRRRDTLAIAAIAGLPEGQIERIIKQAQTDGLLTEDGRITEAGQAILQANRRGERRRPAIVTNSDSYYPRSLRIPRG